MKLLKNALKVIGYLSVPALFVGVFALGDWSWYLTDARPQLDAAVKRLEAAAPINDTQAMSAACDREVWVSNIGMSRVECRLGNYPVLYRGYRLNFTQIDVLYYENMRDRVPNIAVVTLDKDRRPHLVHYRVD